VLNKETHELVTVPMRRDFVALIGNSMGQQGYGNRSDYIRDAIVEKLQRAGVPVPMEYSAGTRRVRVSYVELDRSILNESPPTPGGVSSDVGRGVVAGADAVAAMVAPSATPAPSPKAASTTYKKRARPARTAPRRNSPRSAPAPVPNERGNPT